MKMSEESKFNVLCLVYLCGLGVLVIIFLPPQDAVEDEHFGVEEDVNSVVVEPNSVEPNESKPIGELISMPIP